MYYVYIIESLINADFYKGYTTDFLERLKQHNNGESEYTSHLVPWKLVYVEKFTSKKDALIRERKLKRCNKKYLLWLISQPCNILDR